MSRKSWRRCPITGIPSAQLKQLPAEYLTDDDKFDPSSLSDCNLFSWRAVATAAGFPNVYDFKRRALAEGSSYFHLHQLKSDEYPDDGKWPLGIATHQDSADWGKKTYKAAKEARQLGGKRVDVSAGSGANLAGSSPPIETCVTELQGGGVPFVPEVWPLPIAPRQPRKNVDGDDTIRSGPSAPLREARCRPGPSRLERQADPAVAPRNDDPELEKEMRNQVHEDARRLLTTTGPLDFAAIAAGLRISTRDGRVALAWALRNTDGTIIGEPGERGILYVAP